MAFIVICGGPPVRDLLEPSP